MSWFLWVANLVVVVFSGSRAIQEADAVAGIIAALGCVALALDRFVWRHR